MFIDFEISLGVNLAILMYESVVFIPNSAHLKQLVE